MQTNCNCCTDSGSLVPAPIYNRPGLSTIAYRVGTHPQFKKSLLSRLSGSDQQVLRRLTTRSNDDFSIGLLDAWSVVADVLTFYQERIANESYLRTATERGSVLEMARLIGYELRPGVAAAACLAFTLEDTPAILGPVLGTAAGKNPVEGLPPLSLPSGIRIQSIPGPGEQAQTFETIEPVAARAEWNAIKPRLSQQQALSATAGLVVLKGTDNSVKQGDVMLLRISNVSYTRKVIKVVLDNEAKMTTVYFNANASLPSYNKPVNLPPGNVNDFAAVKELNNTVINNIINRSWKEDDLAILLESKKWPLFRLQSGLLKATEQQSAATGEAYIFRKRASVFGYNAPKQLVDPDSILSSTTMLMISINQLKPKFTFMEWPLDENKSQVFLDTTYDEVVPGGYIAVQKSGDTIENMPVLGISAVNQRSRTAYGMSARSTKISLLNNNANWWENYTTLAAIRNLSVFVQSERLVMAGWPLEDIVQNDQVTLDRWYPGLKTGQKVVVSGDRSDLPGTSASEIMVLKKVMVDKGFTVVTFTQALTYTYIRSSVNICANVAQATHGESVSEILGSGDAGVAFQSFVLRQPPLTWIGAATASGIQSTLSIRVNDLLWQEVPYFYGHTSEERIYITRLDNDGKTTVIFGDGITGARLPSGQENIKANYRKGIGTGGLVKASQLSQLLTRPLGVKSAVNPVEAAGAADAERLDEARDNAPLTILTLDRIVSLQDYEDFARAYTGIEKSLATWTWKGQKRNIFITVAGTNGEEVKKDSLLYNNLLLAIRNAGDTHVPVTLESYVPKYFRVAANIKIDPAYLNDIVLNAVTAALRSNFSFRARSFGQPVNLSELIAVIQQVAGVTAVDVDYLYLAADAVPAPHTRLIASIPVTNNDTVFAAELLTLDPQPIDLKVIV